MQLALLLVSLLNLSHSSVFLSSERLIPFWWAIFHLYWILTLRPQRLSSASASLLKWSMTGLFICGDFSSAHSLKWCAFCIFQTSNWASLEINRSGCISVIGHYIQCTLYELISVYKCWVFLGSKGWNLLPCLHGEDLTASCHFAVSLFRNYGRICWNMYCWPAAVHNFEFWTALALDFWTCLKFNVRVHALLN